MIQNLIQNNRNITYQITISSSDLLKDERLSTTEWAEELDCTNDHASRLMIQATTDKKNKTIKLQNFMNRQNNRKQILRQVHFNDTAQTLSRRK